MQVTDSDMEVRKGDVDDTDGDVQVANGDVDVTGMTCRL